MATRSIESLKNTKQSPKYMACLMYIDDPDEIDRDMNAHKEAVIMKKDGTKITVPILLMDTAQDIHANVDNLEIFVNKKYGV